MSEEELRALDILLGSNGFGEDAKLLSVKKTDKGYYIRGHFSDGEEFECEGELSPLEEWAIRILKGTVTKSVFGNSNKFLTRRKRIILNN